MANQKEATYISDVLKAEVMPGSRPQRKDVTFNSGTAGNAMLIGSLLEDDSGNYKVCVVAANANALSLEKKTFGASTSGTLLALIGGPAVLATEYIAYGALNVAATNASLKTRADITVRTSPTYTEPEGEA